MRKILEVEEPIFVDLIEASIFVLRAARNQIAEMDGTLITDMQQCNVHVTGTRTTEAR